MQEAASAQPRATQVGGQEEGGTQQQSRYSIQQEELYIFRSGRISSVYIVGWLVVGWLLVGCHTFSKFVYFECCSVVMMVY